MNKKLLTSIIIIASLSMNVYTLISLCYLKQQPAVAYRPTPESDELHSCKVNLWTGIQNAHIKLEEIAVKDSSGNNSMLSGVMKTGWKDVLVCRFSESNCESCVNSAIQSLRYCADSLGKDNILFLGAYRNNKIFNRTKPLYDIQELNVYNTSALNLPAEELGYPYFFVLHSDMTVSNVFVPDKAVPAVTGSYLKMIYKRYFAERE